MDDKKLVKALRCCAKEDCNGCPMEGRLQCMSDLMSAAASRLQLLRPPCKIGDKVWGILRRHNGMVPHQGRVAEMYYTDDVRLCVVVKQCCRGEFGKVVFCTEKEARAAIKKMQEENKWKD